MTGGSVDAERLARLLGRPELAWLVERLRERLAAGRPLTGTVTRQPATVSERSAVAELLGRPLRPAASVSVALTDVEGVLRRAGVAPDLRAAVEALAGPVADRAASAAAGARAWGAVVEEVAGWAATVGLTAWLDDVAASGLLRRLAGEPARARALLSDAAAVIDRLPADGVPRGRLAAETLGDGHGLDDDRPVATLVLRAWAVRAGVGRRADGQTPGSWREEVWAAAGVGVGELAAPVLTFGLPGDDVSAGGRVLGLWAEAGQPVHLSLRQLLSDGPRLPVAGRRVFVCENPAVVAAAADRLGTHAAPLVCTGGQPSTAAATLLRLLAGAGARLAHHGDFDWPGLRIANRIAERFGADPWRMATTDYQAAVSRSRRPLEGPDLGACWDPALRPAMVCAGVRVEEELVLDDLLADLAT